MVIKFCIECGKPFEANRASHKYCSVYCANKHGRKTKGVVLLQDQGRFCKQCGTAFSVPSGRGGNNRWHCSDECSVKSARESRSKFWAKQPDAKAKMGEYHAVSREKVGPDGNLKRFRKRYPHVLMACQSCGDTRVLDIAHKPEHRRNGAWRSVENTTPEKVWILCPTCHALLDRMHYPPEDLGLSRCR